MEWKGMEWKHIEMSWNFIKWFPQKFQDSITFHEKKGFLSGQGTMIAYSTFFYIQVSHGDGDLSSSVKLPLGFGLRFREQQSLQLQGH